MEQTTNKTIINLQNKDDAAAYLKKNFAKNMYFGEGILGMMANRIWEGKELTDKEQTVLSTVLPMSVGSYQIGDKVLKKGTCWNLSNEYPDGNINLEIGTLTMESGSSIVCRGKVLAQSFFGDVFGQQVVAADALQRFGNLPARAVAESQNEGHGSVACGLVHAFLQGDA